MKYPGDVLESVQNLQTRALSSLRACLHGGGGPQVGEVSWGGSPRLTCKRDHIKVRDYMDRQVIPTERVPSPTWGPPPPCKQALKIQFMSVRNRQQMT